MKKPGEELKRVGFEPTKHVNAADLQSDAIVHSAIPKKNFFA